MIELTNHAFLNFADALKMLASSQSDVTELVTKFDELCDTTTPRTLTITVGGVEHTVDNLAKIRQDLVEGLSLDKPTVTEIVFRGRQASGDMDAAQWESRVVNDAGSNDFNTAATVTGAFRYVSNDFYTVCMPNRSRVDTNMLRLPRVALIGAVATAGETPVDTVDIYVSAPPAAMGTQDVIVGSSQYYTLVTFVNRNIGNGLGAIVPAKVTVKLHDQLDSFPPVVREIPPYGSATFLFFAGTGQSTVQIQEIVTSVP